MEFTKRVVILVDMDCFYCQVEEGLNPELKGKPIAVVQYNAWKGGGIIAVNYPAKDRGVTRHMRGDEAKEKCPEIELVRVSEVRGKADLSKYRDAGKRVANVLQTFTPLLERASVDEAYLDVTEEVNRRIKATHQEVTLDLIQNTHVVGYDVNDFLYNSKHDEEFSESNLILLYGAVLAEEIRSAVYEQTGYRCSAGIAHNKLLAKLVCGLHKPNKQTILPHNAVTDFFKDLPIRKITGLGGKFGDYLSEDLGISYIGELTKYSEKQLIQKFDEKNGTFLYNLARGINLDPVTTRLVSKSIGCCKRFPGKSSLITQEDVSHWINELASEISERLEKDLEENNRKAKQMVISFSQKVNKKEISSSRTHPLNSYDESKISQNALSVIQKHCLHSDGSYAVTFLGISAGNFEENKKVLEITSFFKRNSNKLSITPTKVSQVNTITNNDNFTENIIAGTSNSDLQNKLLPLCNNNVVQNENSNSSIWSANTEEFSEDEENFVFYPKSTVQETTSNNLIENNISNCSNDSISNEIDPNINNFDNSDGTQPRSFFMMYFNQKQTETNNVEESQRDFDTSKILESEEITDESEDNSCNLNTVFNNTVPSLTNEATSILKNEILNDFVKVCPQCNKTIPNDSFISHMDYHFALQIVKEESNLYKQTPRPPISEIVIKSKKGTKRKNKSLDSKCNITTFFQKDDIDLDNSELCTDCNKRIKLEEIDSHKDYHIAKKLHSEINQYKPVVVKKNTVINNSKPKKGKNAQGNLQNITSFLKPL